MGLESITMVQITLLLKFWFLLFKYEGANWCLAYQEINKQL
jgi:hypothetical protein